MDHVSVEIDAAAVLGELDRLALPPDVEKFEGILLTSFVATEEHVHIITGKLKASGHPDSSFDGETWAGTLSYARDPGIYELARGNTPTANHPDGDHFFFDPPEGSEVYRQLYEQAVLDHLGHGHGFLGG